MSGRVALSSWSSRATATPPSYPSFQCNMPRTGKIDFITNLVVFGPCPVWLPNGQSGAVRQVMISERCLVAWPQGLPFVVLVIFTLSPFSFFHYFPRLYSVYSAYSVYSWQKQCWMLGPLAHCDLPLSCGSCLSVPSSRDLLQLELSGSRPGPWLVLLFLFSFHSAFHSAFQSPITVDSCIL